MDIEKEKSAFQQWYDQYRLESLRHGYGPDATLEQHPHWSTGFESHMKLAWMARAATETPTIKEACEYLRRSAALIAISGDQSMALAIARNADRIERGEPQPSIRKRCMSRADAQQAFDAIERAYWSSVEILDAEPSQPSDKPFPHEDIQHLLPSAETGCFTDALKESSDVREQRMARGTLPKD